MDSITEKLNLKLHALRITFAVIAGLLISSLKLDLIESYFFDSRMAIKATLEKKPLSNTPIILVLINSKTIEKFQGDPKYSDHIKFINELINLNPKYIVYELRTEDGDFVDIKGTTEEKKSFADSVKNFSNVLFSTQDLKMRGVADKLQLKSPLDTLTLYSMPFSADNKSFGADGVTRRLMFQYQNQSMQQPILAAAYNPSIQNIENIKGQFYYLDSQQMYIDFHEKGAFPTYSFEDVVDQKIPANVFKDKIVIVGSDVDRSIKDYVTTPLSRASTAMTKAELQANQIQTLIDNRAPRRVPKPLDIAITVIISILTVYVTLSLTPAKGLLILAATLITTTTLATGFFVIFGIWFDLAHPLFAIFLCYYFFIPYRLIKENRRSWEYYQKHKLLSDVEQLKTNFISMMSHDLKTPIARITGMTEVIYKDPVQLSTQQREALDTIRHSSDDLLKFINAILQYGSIESQGVQLHKQSKDINQLISEVVRKHEFLAKVKKIKMTQELEPMFPMAVDPELIKQVFSNLLENAIKYSPDDSVVQVRSREDGNYLVVEFQDQGMGIPQEDLPNIFMKFYRTHRAKTTTIKGSGLGLYLAQYFVELHHGKISVESSPHTGSIFVVKLPLEK